MVKIYVLKDPRSLVIRYVGATSQTLNRRLTGHMGDTKLQSNTHKVNWLRELKYLGLKPIIELIEETEDWVKREKFWYDHYKALVTLTNSRDGGTGVFKKDLNSIERSSQAKFQSINQYTIDGKLLQAWDCIRDAELHYSGKRKGPIRVCVRGATASAHGFLWSYKDKEPMISNRIATPKKPLKVLLNDGTEKPYRSIRACAIANKISITTLHRALLKNSELTEDIVHSLQKCRG